MRGRITMKQIRTIAAKRLTSAANKGGCGECQASCQSACKTSCTVGSQACERSDRKVRRPEKEKATV